MPYNKNSNSQAKSSSAVEYDATNLLFLRSNSHIKLFHPTSRIGRREMPYPLLQDRIELIKNRDIQ